ncbi:MAG: hypothetical protein AAFQ82_10405 [Myxococcota bacterium]
MTTAVYLLLVLVGADEADVRLRARAEFRTGMEAVSSSDYATARGHLRRSLELFPAAATAFNLAISERALGEYVEAKNILQRLKAKKYGALSPKADREVDRWLNDVKTRVSVLVVTLEGDGTVVVGEVELAMTGGRGSLEVNPGEHRVRVWSESGSLEQRVRAVSGETHRVEFVAPERISTPAPAAPVASLESSDEESGRWLRSPWFWGGVGLVAGGAVLTFVLLNDSASDLPPAPDFGPIRF